MRAGAALGERAHAEKRGHDVHEDDDGGNLDANGPEAREQFGFGHTGLP